jgi:hypothetical protein
VEVYVPRVADCERVELTTSAASNADARRVENALYVAVVHAVDGVRFTTAAASRRELVHRIAEYVQRWGGYVLRPDHARHLRGLLARGEWEAAVELYFGVVGKRWDKEWLVTAVVDGRESRNAAAELGEIASLTSLATSTSCSDRQEPRGADARASRGHVTHQERAG